MDIDLFPLSSLSSLSVYQKSKLLAGGVKTVKDLILANPPDLARALKIGLDEVNAIVDKVSEELDRRPVSLDEAGELNVKFTSGDRLLDEALGGGIRTGLLWEFCGENASGKSQLAMQLALSVQLPHALHGLLGRACYITTIGKLRTERLSEMINDNPLFQNDSVSLSNIYTLSVQSAEGLISVLKYTVSDLIEQLNLGSPIAESRRLRLLILDSITRLVRVQGKTSTKTLVDRSKLLYQIAGALRAIAFKHSIAIVIINEVTDVFDRPLPQHDGPEHDLLQYQFQFIGRANSLPGENLKEAALGMVWSNQINVRTMLTRTSRRHQLPSCEEEPSAKRRKTNPLSGVVTYESVHQHLEHTILLRRMSVIFNPISKPISLDYIVTSAGVSVIRLIEVNSDIDFSQSMQSNSGQLGPPRPSTEEEEEQSLWNEFDEFDDQSFISDFNKNGYIDPLYLQQAVLSAPDQSMEETQQIHREELEYLDEEGLWENMPDLSQFIPPDE